jgi:hypothetical protein
MSEILNTVAKRFCLLNATDSDYQYLIQRYLNDLMHSLHSQMLPLTPTELNTDLQPGWKKTPHIRYVFAWLVLHSKVQISSVSYVSALILCTNSAATIKYCILLQHPQLSRVADVVMPVMLSLVDDHETSNKVLGIVIAAHFIRNINLTELKWYGSLIFQVPQLHPVNMYC